MLDIKSYKNLEEAFRQIMIEDKEYNLIKHNISSNYTVKEHFHPDFGEWLIFDSGEFEVAVDFERQTINAQGASAIYFPAGYIHGLKSLTDISYLVLREGKDKTIYLEGILKKKPLTEPIIDPCGLLWELYSCDNLSIAYDEVIGTAKEHKHEKLQEKYRVDKGRGQLVINNKIFDIKEGDVIPIPKKTWHYLKKIEESPLGVLVITHPRYDHNDLIFKE